MEHVIENVYMLFIYVSDTKEILLRMMFDSYYTCSEAGEYVMSMLRASATVADLPLATKCLSKTIMTGIQI